MTFADIRQAVAGYYGLPIFALTGPCLARERSRPRQIAMYLGRKHTALSTAQIAYHLNRKDHTTVLHGVAAIAEKLRADPEIARDVALIEHRLGVAV